MNLLDLSDKTVLVTGGVGAIGRVVVQTLAEHGATVAVNDVVSEADAAEILGNVDSGNGQIAYFRADNREPEQVEQMLDQVTERMTMPDVVCCHAGIVHSDPITQYPLERFDSLMDINLRAAFVVAQAAAKRWIEHHQKGLLIFTTSWVQDVPWPEITPYNVSKSGLRTLMRGFARELAPHGIRANAIAPGIVGVGMAKRQWDTEPQYRARAEKAIPLGEMQAPESVAHGFLVLCSPLAAYMTGSVLLMDGGCSLYPMD